MKPVLLALAFVGAWFLGGAIVAQDQPKDSPKPALTEVQRLKLQVLAQRIELAQLKAQAAQAEFDKARADLQDLLRSLAVPGYDFDVNTLAYVPKPPARSRRGEQVS